MQTNQNQSQTPAISMSDIFSLVDFQKRYGDKLTLSQIKWYLRNRDRNGLRKSGAVIVSARKYYIVESAFTNWFISQARKH